MACVSLVSFSFNINGQVSGHVTPTRGLRQGDPLSPYIFVMCAEVLSSMIRKSIAEGQIHGVKVCRGAPEISHLFFADDNIFFTRSSVEESCRLKSILTRYCQASGQVINYEKSEISFSANVDSQVRARIIECLNVREVTHQNKYLGLPSVIGRSKKVVFQAILDKIKKKLGGWKEKTLSIAGKEVLIKSVAQAMPMYVMNIFLLPGNLIDDIHKALNAYWWGDGVKQNPIRWCMWERMCVSKFRGGLGFRHLGLFNKSLLAKQVWRLITSPTTLAARTLKARYFPRSSFFDAKIGYRPSYIWRSFLSVKDIVRKGCKWNIGDGRSVNVWNDFWVDDYRSLGPKPDNCEVDQVRDLLNIEGDGWNHELLYSLFPHNIASKIACCYVSKSRNDVLYWHNSPGGRFSCKSAYLLALEEHEDMVRTTTISDNLIDFWRVVWKARVPSKVKLFMWRAWNNYVPTIDNLQSRGLNPTSSCTHCGETSENLAHVLFKCSVAKDVWNRCNFGWSYDTQGAVTFQDFCQVFLENCPTEWETFMMILWGLWTRRNKHFHGQLNGREENVEVIAKSVLSEYHKANQIQNLSGSSGVHNIHAGKWLRPDVEHIKINCDAAWQKESGKAGLGFVARDYKGEALFSGGRFECYASSPLEAEAKAVHWAMTSVVCKGYSHVIFETDSLCLVKALHNKVTPLQIASLFSDILSKSMAFSVCNWSFVKREGNRVAHSIASLALSCPHEFMLDGSVPSCANLWMSKDVILSNMQ